MGCAVRFGSSGFGTKKVNGIRQKKKLFSILIDSLRFHSLRALLFSALADLDLFEAEPFLASGSIIQLASTRPCRDTFYDSKPGETSRNKPARTHRPKNPVGLFGLRFARSRSLRSARFGLVDARPNLAGRRPLAAMPNAYR